MADTSSTGASDPGRIHGDPAALASVTVTKVADGRVLSSAETEALLGRAATEIEAAPQKPKRSGWLARLWPMRAARADSVKDALK